MMRRKEQLRRIVRREHARILAEQVATTVDAQPNHVDHAWPTSAWEDAEELVAFRQAWIEENGTYPYATLDETLDHFDHVVELVGVDYVGIGSDYDGVGDSLPIGLKDVSSYPNLVEGLIGRGYSDEDIVKILGGNMMRVWREVEAVAGHR